MRGGGDFWAWRETMIALADVADAVDEIRREYVEVYRELRANGYTAVGEFHYLGLEEARAAAAAAEEAGIAVRLPLRRLRCAAVSPASARTRWPTTSTELEPLRAEGIRVGVAPHSVRACPADCARGARRYAAEHELPLHVHADEQPREIDECLAEHGLRPIELLARTGCLGPRTTVVHATHAEAHELDLLARRGPRICMCPTTEANLGDGFRPSRASATAGSALHRLRLQRPHRPARGAAGARRRSRAAQTGKRGVVSVGALLCFGSDGAARRSGSTRWPDAIVDLDHPQLRGVAPADVYEALVFGCAGDVLREDVRPVARPHEVRVLARRGRAAPRAVVGSSGSRPCRPAGPQARSASPRATRCTT